MAARNLSLAAYRALSRSATAGYVPPVRTRPEGELLWVHLGHGMDAPAVFDFCHRLRVQRDGICVLVTCPTGDATQHVSDAHPDWLIVTEVPDEHPRSVVRFLEHWSPDLGLWVWGGLRPNLVDEAFRAGLTMHLVSAHVDGFDTRRERWLPELSRYLVGCFASATVRSPKTMLHLAKLGMATAAIRIEKDLSTSGRILPCADADLNEAMEAVGGRAVWFAAQTVAEEWPVILTAHRRALRGAHRLLLVLNPRADASMDALRNRLQTHELSHASWETDDPTDTTQVLISEDPEELGLWYRIAAVTFAGGTLVNDQPVRDPFEAAALGTVVLYGPHVRPFTDNFSRLARAGAARIVNDGENLGAAVATLIAPDQAAQMAHAGWNVVTESAEVVDSLIELVQDGLENPATRTDPI